MERTPEQEAESKAVVTVLAAVLERLVKSNESNPNGNKKTEVTKYHALKAPGITIQQYLYRIHKYTLVSTESFVLALIYIDRLIQRNNFVLSELNVHRVVITAVLIAAKFFDDHYYNNQYFSRVGGVLLSEMNSLEVDFLFRVNFSLHVKPDIYAKYQSELVSHAVGAGIEQHTLPQPVSLVAPINEPLHNAIHTMALQEVIQQPQQQQYFQNAVTSAPGVIQQPQPYAYGNVTPSPTQTSEQEQEQTRQVMNQLRQVQFNQGNLNQQSQPIPILNDYNDQTAPANIYQQSQPILNDYHDQTQPHNLCRQSQPIHSPNDYHESCQFYHNSQYQDNSKTLDFPITRHAMHEPSQPTNVEHQIFQHSSDKNCTGIDAITQCRNQSSELYNVGIYQ